MLVQMKKWNQALILGVVFVAFVSVVYVLTSPNTYPFSFKNTEIIGPLEEKFSQVTENTPQTTPKQENIVAKKSNVSGLHICDRSPEPDFESMLCYTAKTGDTLWGIAERYLGTGFHWGELHDGAPRNGEYQRNPETHESVYVGYSRLEDPATQLRPGMEVGMHTSSMLPLELAADADRYFVETSKLSDFNGNLLIVVNTRESNQKLVYLNGKRYDERTYGDISHINFSDDGTHISYIAKNSWDTCEILIDRIAYEFTCGNDIQDPLFSQNRDHFAFRTNLHNQVLWTGPDKFYIVSDLGNGPHYDFIDSLMWVDHETLIYRAQTNDEWRVVINHEDVAVFNYLENLKVENGLVTFNARNVDGSWTTEAINLNQR